MNLKTTFIFPDDIHTEFQVAAIRHRPKIDKSKLFGLLLEEYLIDKMRGRPWALQLQNVQFSGKKRAQTFYISEAIHTEFHIDCTRFHRSMSQVAACIVARFLRGESAIANATSRQLKDTERISSNDRYEARE